ncbi:MAG TPA: CHAT domain-containing tetratricopeptide repeat protein [Puia sp.]|nr:CHAT domain-containing tetratricopeptide repeat protein [Puia sp.]
MPALNYNNYTIIRQAILACWCLLLVSYQAPSPPQSLREQLRQDQTKDNLTEWIYTQIQWVVKSPATRATLLVQATEKAWRSPHSNEEIQAWQDLLSNEGYALLMSGDIVHSTDAYTAAFQWARQHQELADEVLVLENILKPLGNNYIRLGDYEQALFIHRKALAIATSLQDKDEDKDALAGTYSNLANTSSNMGLPELSLDYCRQGLNVVNKHSALCGLLLSEQADACEQLQQDNAARESIRKSITVLQQASAGKQANPEAGYWLLMAYQQAGDIYSDQPELALQFYTRALSLQNSLSQRHGSIRKREQAKLFQRLGALCARSGQPARAEYWLDQCLSVLIPGKKAGSLQEADLYAENTLMDLLFTLAGLYERQDHTDQALYLYTLCFATEKKLRRELITGSSRERSVSDSRLRYETAIHTAWTAWERTGQPKYQQAILGFMESSKSQLLLEEILRQQQVHPASDSLAGRIRLLERALVYYRKEALLTENNDSLTRSNTAQEKQTVWDLAQLRKKASAEKISTPVRNAPAGSSLAADPTHGAQAATTDSPGSSLHSILRDGQITRSFFAGSAALYAVECDRSGIRFAERLPLDSKGQDSIRTFIHTYFEEGANAMINRPGDYYRQAYTIYHQLFGLHPLLPGKEYILLPDGPLSLLPVEALVTNPSNLPSPEKWPFVVRQSLISYAWSLRTLQEQVLTPAKGKGVAGFFLSGNQDKGKSPLLKAVTREKEGIAGILKDGNWYSDEQATTAAFRKALEGSALLHISSHAFTKKDTLEAPHIELFDEPFYLFELQGWDHHPALIVLSACRTGDGRMVTGEGVQSLARAFTAGGANAVIAGWWNVNDEAAAQLMQGFYSALATGEPSPGSEEHNPGLPQAVSGSKDRNAAQALRLSKLNWLDAPAISYVHKLPYFWAALNYQGNTYPLQRDSLTVKGSRSNSVWWWWSLLLLPVAGLLARFRR